MSALQTRGAAELVLFASVCKREMENSRLPQPPPSSPRRSPGWGWGEFLWADWRGSRQPPPHLLRLPHHPSPPGSTPHFFVLKAPPPPRGFSPGGPALAGVGVGPRLRVPPPTYPDPSPLLTSHLLFPPRSDPRGASSLAGHQREAGNWRWKLSRQGAQRPLHPRPAPGGPPPPPGTPPEPRPPRHSSLTFSQASGRPTPPPPLPPCPPSALFMFQPIDLHRPRPWP